MIARVAAPLGYRPDEIRDMIPLDWLLIARGHADQARRAAPGGTAPSAEEVAALVEEFG